VSFLWLIPALRGIRHESSSQVRSDSQILPTLGRAGIVSVRIGPALISFAPDTDWDYWNWPEMLDELREIFGREVDLVVKESLRNPFRRHRILTEREVLHAA